MMHHEPEPATSQLPTERPLRSETRLRRVATPRATLSLSELQNALAAELGEQAITFKARGWAWARKQLRQGQCVARYSWRLHERPKPLFLYLKGYGKDLNECDWYRPQQLELAR